jgi:hypothetical protein
VSYTGPQRYEITAETPLQSQPFPDGVPDGKDVFGELQQQDSGAVERDIGDRAKDDPDKAVVADKYRVYGGIAGDGEGKSV